MAHVLDDDTGSRLAGRTGTADLVVTDGDTATAWGSGDIAVLATPRMIALMEQAACAAIASELPDAVTTVGVRLDVRHVEPTPVGAAVRAVARVESVDGDRIAFEVTATQDRDGGQVLIGSGTHLRVAVDAAAFVARLDAQR